MKKSITILFILATGIGTWIQFHSAPIPESESKLGRYQGTIKVGHLVALDMAPMFIAKEAGFFKEQGLDVETIFFSNPGDSNAALAGGDLQFIINPFTLPFLAENQGVPMRIISSAGGLEIIEIVMQGEHQVDSIKQLKERVINNPGKKLKIGTLQGDTLDMIIYRALLEEGLTYDDFEIIWFNDLLAMVQSFQTKQIDILSHIKPYTTDLIKNYDANVLTNNDLVRGKGTPNTTTVVMQEFIDLYPETIKAYLKAQQQGVELLINNPEKAVELLTKGNYYRVDKETLLFAIKNQSKEIILQPNVNGMMKAINDMVIQGYIEPVSESVVDNSFLETLSIQ